MNYHPLPDAAVFVVNGRTVSAAIQWRGHEGFLAVTGEKLRDVIRRVDSAKFFVDGTPTDCSFVRAL